MKVSLYQAKICNENCSTKPLKTVHRTLNKFGPTLSGDLINFGSTTQPSTLRYGSKYSTEEWGSMSWGTTCLEGHLNAPHKALSIFNDSSLFWNGNIFLSHFQTGKNVLLDGHNILARSVKLGDNTRGENCILGLAGDTSILSIHKVKLGKNVVLDTVYSYSFFNAGNGCKIKRLSSAPSAKISVGNGVEVDDMVAPTFRAGHNFRFNNINSATIIPGDVTIGNNSILNGSLTVEGNFTLGKNAATEHLSTETEQQNHNCRRFFTAGDGLTSKSLDIVGVDASLGDSRIDNITLRHDCLNSTDYVPTIKFRSQQIASRMGDFKPNLMVVNDFKPFFLKLPWRVSMQEMLSKFNLLVLCLVDDSLVSIKQISVEDFIKYFVK